MTARKKQDKVSRQERAAQRAFTEEIDALELAALFEDTYVCSMEEILAKARLTTPFIVQDTIPENGLTVLAGRPGSHKSWLAYEMAIAVARGEPWLGLATEKGKVLILNYDNPTGELGRRFLRLEADPTDTIWFHSIAAKPPPKRLPAMLLIPEAMKPILAIIGRLMPDLIIIDSLRQSHTGDEHSSRDMSLVMACLKQMTSYGGAVLALHHLRKKAAGQEEDDEPLRGSTEIEASSDSILIAEDDAVRYYKCRGWIPERTARDFSVVDEDDQTLVIGKIDYRPLIKALEKGPLGKNALAKEVGTDRKGINRLLARAQRAGIVRPYARKKGHESKDQFELTRDP